MPQMSQHVRSMPQQIETDGFAIVERVFDALEVDSILATLAGAPLPRSRAGARHAMQNSAVAEIARDSRLMRIARSVLGRSAVPFRATLFDKSPAANWLVVWHQDTVLPLRSRMDASGWGPWSMKAGIIYAHAPTAALDSVLALRIHLDDSTASNGPLRVLPGTHARGVLTDEAVQESVRETKPFDCLVPRGGVLAMRPLLIHASSKLQTEIPRRVLHIEYACSMEVGYGLELAVA